MIKKLMFTLIAVAMLSFAAAPATAGEPGEVSPGPEPGMGYKFGRGAVNVLTCWTEIPRNVALEWQRTDPASGFFLGVGKGLGYGYTRFVGGVYDMVTFAFPVPMGFVPVMEPEFSVYNEYREAPSGRLTVEPLDVAAADEPEEPVTRYSARSKRQWP
jgi:putative exosortase-associated protein (TIGR04073 family)